VKIFLVLELFKEVLGKLWGLLFIHIIVFKVKKNGVSSRRTWELPIGLISNQSLPGLT
jgi:hypothetical protein